MAAGNLNAGSDLAKVQWMVKIGAKYSNLADYEVNDSYIENATQKEETYTYKFWNSTIYQLALYNFGSLLSEMQQTFSTLKMLQQSISFQMALERSIQPKTIGFDSTAFITMTLAND